MISFSGFKVWPAEVEEVLYSHPDIKEACVIAVPDQRTGEKVKAVIVTDFAGHPADWKQFMKLSRCFGMIIKT